MLEVEVWEAVVVVWEEMRRGFLGAEVEAEEPTAAPAGNWRSRRRAAGTQVLLTWVEQSKPRDLQQVRHRLWLQSFLAWLPQSWHVDGPPLPPPPTPPAPPRIPAASSMGRGFLW